MFGYGKMSGCAVAAVSALAECYADERKLSAQQIAESRNLSKPLVAKVLTVLSQNGLVTGTRGPGGGYRIARHPASISLFDVIVLFDGHRDPSACPFGPGWCNVSEPCPIHHLLVGIQDVTANKLKKANFGAFIAHAKPDSRSTKAAPE